VDAMDAGRLARSGLVRAPLFSLPIRIFDPYEHRSGVDKSPMIFFNRFRKSTTSCGNLQYLTSPRFIALRPLEQGR